MTPAHPNDEQLSAYLDGELRQAASVVAPGEAFPAHLAACDACRLRLAALAGPVTSFASPCPRCRPR